MTDEQNDKMVYRPSQTDVHYTPDATGTERCASCRWFIANDNGGPSCHLIQPWPLDILPTGTCERYEVNPMIDEVANPSPPPEVKEVVAPEFVDEPVVVALDGSVSVPVDGDSTLTHEWTAAITTDGDVTPLPDGTVVVIDAYEPDTVHVEHTVTDGSGKSITGYIKAKVAELFKRDDDDELTEFKVVGNSFLITWSNNFKDRDDEIFTEKAIDRYVARVDVGIVPSPEVWVWHVGKAVRIGQASIVARHGHFTFAAGEFDSDAKAQRARDYYAKPANAKKTSVSHGFTFRKDKFDGQHYHEFNTFEISLLPRGKEANRFTTLEGVKDMAVTPEKLKYLEDVFGKETVDGMLADLEERGKALEEIGVAYKDFVDVDAAPVETEAAKEAVEVANKDFAQLIVDLVGDNAAVLKQTAEIMKAVSAYKASSDATIAAQNATIAALNERLDDRPRSASKDAATIIESDALSDEMKKNLTEYEEFLPGIVLKKTLGE